MCSRFNSADFVYTSGTNWIKEESTRATACCFLRDSLRRVVFMGVESHGWYGMNKKAGGMENV